MRILLLFILISGKAMAQWAPVSPLGIPLLVTAGFGEVRSQHFHSGVDFSTGGRQEQVYAVEEGDVYRIRTSAGGYGKALYISHPNGMGSVYAHLDRFAPELEAFIRDVQVKSRRFEQDTLLGQGVFRIRKGQLIAYSGNTGSSTAPHLHFELRDLNTEAVLNPMEYGIPIRDVTPPEIRSILFIPHKEYGRVNGSSQLLQSPLVVNRKTKKKSLSAKVKMPIVSGWVGFGFRGGDVIGKSKNLSGVYDIQVEVDTELVYHARFDRFSFSETRCVNGYIDYPARIKNKSVLHRCVVPANRMIGIYKQSQNRGYYYFNQNKLYSVRVTLRDYAGNTTIQEIKVRGALPVFEKPVQETPGTGYQMVFSGEEQSLITEGFEAEFWNECLFDTARIQLKQKKVPNAYSPEVAFGSMFIPINQPILIRLFPEGYGPELREKLVIMRRTGQKEVSLGGYWVGNWLSANTNEFGDFRVVADTINPKITFLKSPAVKKKTSGKKKKKKPAKEKQIVSDLPPVYPKAIGKVRFQIHEVHSGIRDIQAWVNDQWVLLEPGQGSGVFEYRFPEGLTPGVYCMRIAAIDGSGNTGRLEMEFEIAPLTEKSK
jgi:hypothetical protein